MSVLDFDSALTRSRPEIWLRGLALASRITGYRYAPKYPRADGTLYACGGYSPPPTPEEERKWGWHDVWDREHPFPSDTDPGANDFWKNFNNETRTRQRREWVDQQESAWKRENDPATIERIRREQEEIERERREDDEAEQERIERERIREEQLEWVRPEPEMPERVKRAPVAEDPEDLRRRRQHQDQIIKRRLSPIVVVPEGAMEWLLHEVGHWVAATPEERLLPNYGIGQEEWGHAADREWQAWAFEEIIFAPWGPARLLAPPSQRDGVGSKPGPIPEYAMRHVERRIEAMGIDIAEIRSIWGPWVNWTKGPDGREVSDVVG